MTDSFDNAATTISAIAENSERLGLTWGMRPATVVSYDWDSNTAQATYDGDDTPIGMTSLAGPLLAGFRVMVMSVPPSANFIVAKMGVPDTGTLVVRLECTGTQSIANNTNTFLNFDIVTHNYFNGGFVAGTPDRFVPPLEGIYQWFARWVLTANATSRRYLAINRNGSTAVPNTLGSFTIQTPDTSTLVMEVNGAGYFNGTTDYVGARCIQASGGPLSTTLTDGGCWLEGYYVGPFLPRAS